MARRKTYTFDERTLKRIEDLVVRSANLRADGEDLLGWDGIVQAALEHGLDEVERRIGREERSQRRQVKAERSAALVARQIDMFGVEPSTSADAKVRDPDMT